MTNGVTGGLPPAVRAFDALAGTFDERFGAWKSVAAQRRAVRRALLGAFPERASLLELGGGTGEDALFLARHRRRVHVTDGAPRMAAETETKARAESIHGLVTSERISLEELDAWALAYGGPRFDGAFSNFASLNCVADRRPVARALARILPEQAHALLVVFGPCCPGEVLVLLARGKGRAAFRRLARGPAPARVGGETFPVTYPAPWTLAREFAPWFRLKRVVGIGVFVPPSGAEPEVSRYPRLLAGLEALDRVFSLPLALLGDHVLLDFERTGAAAEAAEAVEAP